LANRKLSLSCPGVSVHDTVSHNGLNTSSSMATGFRWTYSHLPDLVFCFSTEGVDERDETSFSDLVSTFTSGVDDLEAPLTEPFFFLAAGVSSPKIKFAFYGTVLESCLHFVVPYSRVVCSLWYHTRELFAVYGTILESCLHFVVPYSRVVNSLWYHTREFLTVCGTILESC